MISVDRLMERIEFDTNGGCWLWTGPVNQKGYGRTWVGEKNAFIHRTMWEAENGPIPDGRIACHRCDTPACVNPAHIFIGTHTDNMKDMITKGRRLNGQKLTEAQVIEIRSRKETILGYAQRFGVSQAAVWYALNGITWKFAARPAPAVAPSGVA